MKPFRQNVCAVIANEGGTRVLVFRRVDRRFPKPWQFPQGGLHKGEAPRDGLLRELDEEIGTADVEIVRKLARPIRYVYPAAILRQLEREGSKMARFRGQEQHWFLVRLRGTTDEIHFDHEPREFCDFRWVTPRQAAAGVVPFKRAAYLRGLAGLGLLRARLRAAGTPKRAPAPAAKPGRSRAAARHGSPR
jgi:putative (di)nucleoside polyphosphate hydrolase